MIRPPDRFAMIVDEAGKCLKHRYRRRQPDGRCETIHELCKREYGKSRKLTVREVKGSRPSHPPRRRVFSRPYTVYTKPYMGI